LLANKTSRDSGSQASPEAKHRSAAHLTTPLVILKLLSILLCSATVDESSD